MGESCASIQRKKLDFFLTGNLKTQSAKLCSSAIGKRCSVLETFSASNNVDNNFVSSGLGYSWSRKVQSNRINNALHCNMATHVENSCSNKIYPAPKFKNGHVSRAACYADPDCDEDTSVFMYQYSNSKSRVLGQNEYIHLVPTTDGSKNISDERCSIAGSIHFAPLENSIQKNGFKTYISTALKDDSLVDNSTYENSMSKRVSKVKIRSSKANVSSNTTQPVYCHQQSKEGSNKYYLQNNSEITSKGYKISQSRAKLKKANSIYSSGQTVTNLTNCSSSAGRKNATNDLTPDNISRTGVLCPNNLPILEEMRLPITSSESSADTPKKELSEAAMNKWLAEKNKQQREEEKRRIFIKNRMLLKEQEKKIRAERSSALWLENKTKLSKESQKREKERKAKELKKMQEKLELKELEKKKIALWYRRKEEDLIRKQVEEQRKKKEEEERKIIKQEENARAYKIWLKNSIDKPKPLPSNRGLESIMSSSCVTYKNPMPWKPNIPYPFTE